MIAAAAVTTRPVSASFGHGLGVFARVRQRSCILETRNTS